MIRTIERRGEKRLVIDIVYRRADGTKGRYRRDAQIQTKAAAAIQTSRRHICLMKGLKEVWNRRSIYANACVYDLAQ